MTDLLPGDRTVADGIACASVPLALLGIAEVEPSSLAAGIAAAERRRVLNAPDVTSLLKRWHGRPGSALLRDAMAALQLESSWTRTELERRFLALCRDASLPRPRVNAWISVPGDGFEVDFSWPDHRLVVETDGHADHGDRAAFESDRWRDQRLVAAGWRVVRFTWRQVVWEPGAVAEILRRLLDEIAQPGVAAR